MTNNIKIGGFSCVLNKHIYNKHLTLNNETKNNSCNGLNLLKITYITKYNQNELEILDTIKDERYYNKYFPKIYGELIYLNDSSNLYKYLYKKNLLLEINFKKEYQLCAYFIENCGNQELFDIICDLHDNKKTIFSIDYDIKIYLLVKQLLNGIKFLHTNQLCHFDIKPENILYNDKIINFENRFKIIDFGFSE